MMETGRYVIVTMRTKSLYLRCARAYTGCRLADASMLELSDTCRSGCVLVNVCFGQRVGYTSVCSPPSFIAGQKISVAYRERMSDGFVCCRFLHVIVLLTEIRDEVRGL